MDPAADFPGEHLLNIRMSKLARALQAAAVETNWNDMVKMLFQADPNQGRHDFVRHFSLLNARPQTAEKPDSSYGTDQVRSVLLLVLIISIAEKRSQELYQAEFAQRCDEVSRRYGLKDDQYWPEGKTPAEWEELNRQFEAGSLAILVETLHEYGQNTIAQLVQAKGVEELFGIIKGLHPQFLNVLGSFNPEKETSSELKQVSIPETLLS